MQNTNSGYQPDAADKDFLQLLRRKLDREIANYVYASPAEAIGSPLSSDYIRDCLESMRSCLVEPYWEEVNICDHRQALTGSGVKRRCVTMAEDQSYVLVFYPGEEEYHLAYRGSNGLGTWGITGGGVDCFIAR
jgi:hypothetical protein